MARRQPNVCRTVRARLAGYALGEVIDDPQVGAHLDVCEACQRELLTYLHIAEALLWCVPERSPSASLRTRVMASVTRQSACIESSEE